ncbi:Transposon Ty3-I Gag-Pol poly [Paramuricea clavata]|uniref:Transposon Ty3-I Gag-Pol poly n=1 Tax=Paramuricea clavata TaxID=317549 RepID=A0A7D9I1G8_PARCT|nr:Transposon Ty3-I Gag-Pol poly [Paramuricea clavata]
MVVTDLFQWEQNNYLVVADYYSRYIEVVKLETTTSRTVVNHMKSVFTRHGIPSVVRSDNGPQYTATEYKQFAQKWNFEHQTSNRETLAIERKTRWKRSVLKFVGVSQHTHR